MPNGKMANNIDHIDISGGLVANGDKDSGNYCRTSIIVVIYSSQHISQLQLLSKPSRFIVTLLWNRKMML